MTAAVWVTETVPSAALKTPDVEPAATAREAGTVSAALVELKLTEAPPAGAGALMITVQLADPPGAMLDGLHATEIGSEAGAAGAGGVRVRVAPIEAPPSAAVTVAVCPAVTTAAVVVNAVDAEPAGTVTEGGAVRLASSLLTEIAAPPLGAAALSTTEQVEDAGVASEEGLHESRLRLTGACTAIVPPVPAAATAVPLGEAATVLLKVRVRVPVVADTPTLTVATTPSPIAETFKPVATQR
ncbi:MAG: hypothetical protein LAP40_18755 [Acidobacteriia bacterium]|nr:hypothetical protein [Terriglobia bacterium]